MSTPQLFVIEASWFDAWCHPMDPSRKEGDEVFVVRASDYDSAESAVIEQIRSSVGAGFSVKATEVDSAGFDLSDIDIDLTEAEAA